MNSADRRLPRGCRSFRTWLTDSVQGEPDAAHARHLEGCKPCAGLWQVAGATRAARADLLAATPDPAAVGALLESLVPPVEAPAADGANEAIDPVPPTYDVPPAPTPLLAMDVHRAEPTPSATAVRSARPLIAWAAVLLIGLGGLCALAAHEVWWPFGAPPANQEGTAEQLGVLLNDDLVQELQRIRLQAEFSPRDLEVAREGLTSEYAMHRHLAFSIYGKAKAIPPKHLVIAALDFVPRKVSKSDPRASASGDPQADLKRALDDEAAMTSFWALMTIYRSVKAGNFDWDTQVIERKFNHPYMNARQNVVRILRLFPDYVPPEWLLSAIQRDVHDVRRLATTWLEETD